jgi:cytochrome c551/c552
MSVFDDLEREAKRRAGGGDNVGLNDWIALGALVLTNVGKLFRRKVCVWTHYADDDSYGTSCGEHKHVLTKYCEECGKRVKVITEEK